MPCKTLCVIAHIQARLFCLGYHPSGETAELCIRSCPDRVMTSRQVRESARNFHLENPGSNVFLDTSAL